MPNMHKGKKKEEISTKLSQERRDCRPKQESAKKRITSTIHA